MENGISHSPLRGPEARTLWLAERKIDRPELAAAGYTASMSDDQLRKQLVDRTTTYLWGQVDVLTLGGFDSSPSGMAQGPTHRARGEAFFKFITDSLGAKHKAIIVPECGHNDRCIYTSEEVLPVIFPR